MSHEVETMAYAGEVPWHGLGKPVSNNLSPQEMCASAGILWTVSKVPAFIHLPELDHPNVRKVELSRSALIRDSDQKILDIVPNDWHPLQNEEAFQFFSEFVEAGDMEMHTAGSLKGGTIVWGLAKVKENFIINGKDLVESFLLFTNPHQFGKAIDIRFTPVRVVCWNTMCMAIGRHGSFDTQQVAKINHRKEFDSNKAKMILGIAHNKLETYREAAEFLASKRYETDQLNDFLRKIFPKSGKSDDMSRNHKLALDVIEKQPGAEFSAGSWWQAFNAITYMTDHLMGRMVDTRLQSAWFGSNRDLKTKALEKAIEHANKSKDLIIA